MSTLGTAIPMTPWESELCRLLSAVQYSDRHVYTGKELLEICNDLWNLAYNAHREGSSTAIAVDAMFDDIVRYKWPNYIDPKYPELAISESSELDETDSTDSD